MLFHNEATINTFSGSQVQIQLKQLLYGAMYLNIYTEMNICICGIDIQFGIVYLYSSTTGAAVKTLSGYCTTTQRTEIIYLHFDLFNSMAIYFHLHTTYHYQYQQSLRYQSTNAQTPTTPFNQITFQPAKTIANTSITQLCHHTIQSSHKYNHTDYESIAQAHIESFMAIFAQAELITHYVTFNIILSHTMMQHTMIEVFNIAQYLVHSLFNIILIIVILQYDTYFIITTMIIGYSIIMVYMVKCNNFEQSTIKTFTTTTTLSIMTICFISTSLRYTNFMYGNNNTYSTYST